MAGAPKPDDKKPGTNIINVPNALTVSRIVMTPAIAYFIVTGQHDAAFWTFGVAAATDVADGFIARQFDQRTILGTYLDPSADKFFVTTITIAMGIKGVIPGPLAALMVFRDVAIFGGALYYRYATLPGKFTWKRYFNVDDVQSIEMKPTFIGKANTVLTMGLLGFATMQPVFHVPPQAFMTPLYYTVAATTLWSGFSYLLQPAFTSLTSKDRHGRDAVRAAEAQSTAREHGAAPKAKEGEKEKEKGAS